MSAPDSADGLRLNSTSYCDVGAEMAALGSILISQDPVGTAEIVFTIAPSTDFWAERELAAVLETMWRAGRPIDPQLLLAELTNTGIIAKVGGAPHLHDLIERAWLPTHAKHYADAIHEAWRRRSLARAAVRATQQLENPSSNLTEAALELMGAAEGVYDSGRIKTVDAPADVLDFVEGPSSYDWIVQGLIERLDRVMLTAPEGLAKSVVLAQIAIAVASGRHPFTNDTIEPRRALVIDCEVSPRQQRRRWKWMLETAERLGCPPARGMLRVDPRPDGLDLTGSDLSWVKGRVAASGADIIVIGPLYRLHRQNINDEEVARELVGALDEIRIGSNAALLIEAHAGHGFMGRERDLRPRGSSLFMGWSEFGVALRPVKGDRRVVDVTRWRGDRDMRTWPHRLKWGGPGTWPWVECSPEDEWR